MLSFGKQIFAKQDSGFSMAYFRDEWVGGPKDVERKIQEVLAKATDTSEQQQLKTILSSLPPAMMVLEYLEGQNESCEAHKTAIKNQKDAIRTLLDRARILEVAIVFGWFYARRFEFVLQMKVMNPDLVRAIEMVGPPPSALPLPAGPNFPKPASQPRKQYKPHFFKNAARKRHYQNY